MDITQGLLLESMENNPDTAPGQLALYSRSCCNYHHWSGKEQKSIVVDKAALTVLN